MEKQFFDIIEVEYDLDQTHSRCITTIYASKDELSKFIEMFNEVKGNSDSEITYKDA